ncbi:MAG TPA: DUF1552 domain-containing protein, partial [Rhizomicrobium sp.]
MTRPTENPFRSRAFSRRAVLHGAGCTMALPWLESVSAMAGEAKASDFPKRFGVVFLGCGVNEDHWSAEGQGADMKLGKTLMPLEPLKQKINVIEGLYVKTLTNEGIHPGQTGSLLSGVPITKGALIHSGVSVDQMIAAKVGADTPQSSIVLACEQPMTGYHETNFSLAYSSHISWQTPDSPVPVEIYPALSIVEIDDAKALEWQLVENSQRVDVHPYEEAQGFQRLLDVPGYDVAALVEKSGKSASHVYARLSLLQLIPIVAEAFTQERISASHANLIARLPQESQAEAFEQCWRKDWQDKESHLLPAKHVAAWIQAKLYLSLADAPFDREDPTLNPAAGACVTCPRRSGHNTSLFCDVQGDQCLDSACYHAKVEAFLDREIAAHPGLV